MGRDVAVCEGVDYKMTSKFTLSSNSEPKKTWRYIGYDMYVCNICGHAYTTLDMFSLKNYKTDSRSPSHCCFNCGADMRG